MTSTTKPLPDEASIIVIGGGIMGLSTLYHLAKMGAKDVILLERSKLTSGTTWHSAAQVRQLRSSRELTQMIIESSALYAGLEAETGQATGWLKTGSLSIATNPERLTHIRRQAALARLYGLEVQEIHAAEVARRWPLARTDDIIGAVWSPDDGRINPTDVCAALAKGAKAGSAQIFEDTAVTGFRRCNNRISHVETSARAIACKTVVVCAGLWSGRVAALAGAQAPVQACEHFYLLTKPIEGITAHLPTLSDHDGHLYIRDEVGGLLVGCFEPAGKALPLSSLPEDFSFQLLPEDWDHFEPMMLNALHRLPILETAEVRTLLNGPESFTPDGACLLGPSPDIDGLYFGCGMNSVGIATGGGAGKALATWILDGAPPHDLDELNPGRLHPALAETDALFERAPEVLGLHYATSVPGREFKSARDLRQMPLHQAWADLGAQWGQRYAIERPLYFGDPDPRAPTETFQQPAWFDNIASEVTAACDTAVIIDQSSYGKIRLRGAGAEHFLQHVAANDMSRSPGQVTYTSFLNPRGGIETDLTALRFAANDYLLLTGTNRRHRDLALLRRHAADEHAVEISDETDDHALLALSGPRSADLQDKLSHGALRQTRFGYYRHRDLVIAGTPCTAARISYTGELGWELLIPAMQAGDVLTALMSEGQAFGLRSAGLYAQASMRIEKKYLALGHDIGSSDTPLNAGLDFAVKLDSGINFVGRDALLRTRDAGTSRRLVSLTLADTAANPIGGEPVLLNDQYVGQVTSAAFGHRVGRPIALGYMTLRGEEWQDVEARSFTLDIAGTRFEATASFAAAYDPVGMRARASTSI